MIVAFIEPDDYFPTAKMTIRLWEVISSLVEKENAKVFLFTNAGYFDQGCFKIVSQLKMLHPNIERHYYHGCFDYDVGYVHWMSDIYDKVHFPPMGFPLPSSTRNKMVVDKCDVVVTCGVASAAEYAKRINKRVINVCEH